MQISWNFCPSSILSLCILDTCHYGLLGPFSATNRNTQCRTGVNILNHQPKYWKQKMSWNRWDVIPLSHTEVRVLQVSQLNHVCNAV
jgi:hypothetical protein